MTWISFDDWMADARAADLVAVAGLLGASGLKPQGHELVGPCPGCGGEDRFSINPAKRVWNCGHRSGAGGDVIALVGHVRGLDPKNGGDFVRICEEINGAPPPERDRQESAEDRAEREARMAAREREAAEATARREHEAETYRDAEIRRALEIWEAGHALPGTHAEAYLTAREIRHTAGLRLRFVERIGYFVPHERSEDERLRGVKPYYIKVCDVPALVGAIVDAEGRFRGAHITHLDPVEPRKARIVHPETGEIQPAKKIRGSVHGGVLRLAGPVADPARLVMGEGIETTLSVRDALIDAGRATADTAWWAGVSLGNMAGKATESVRHPDGLTKTDKAGRARAVMVPGPVPLPSDHGIDLPASIVEATLLGDGDSEPATTDFALRRCAARWARPGLVVRRAWALDGGDFNDMRRDAPAESGGS